MWKKTCSLRIHFALFLGLLLLIHIFSPFSPLPIATEKKFSVEEYPRLKVENQSAELFCNYTCKSSKLMTMKVSLLKGIKGTEEVCSIHWNGTYNSSKVNSEFRCFMNVSKEDGSVTFKLRNLHINQTDIYNCRIDILYPPPFDRRSSKGVVIHVKGKNMKTVSD